jgi:outer membrane protein OmpA-like peptidoglycan-associated protein/opacity protein-like surface antigen
MKNLHQQLSRVMIALLMAAIPFVSMAQEGVKETKIRTNTAPCYNYWSVGAFGGLTQFNGDLSRNLWVNISPNNIGYNVGLNITKQFSRVIGVRARFAYAHLHSDVQDKWVWEYMDGSGNPQKVTKSFRTSLFESDLQVTVNWLNWILGYKPERIFSSYLFGGVGVDHSSGTLLDGNETEIAYLGKGGDALNVGNTSGLGGDNIEFKVSAGLGFDFNLSKHFSVPIEFAWRWQNSDLLDMTRGGAQGMVNDMYSSATVGITYKFGYSCPDVPKEAAVFVPAAVLLPDPTVRFFVVAPRNIPVERKVREVFPLRNYIFFDLGSKEIPDRYVLLSKDQVKDFKEEQVELFTPKNLSGRSDRQMVVYYNVINILGDRMGKNPAATVRLSGASLEGPDDGRAMAESVKRYLVSVFGIEATRITTEGRIKPRDPSEQPGGTKELDLLREGDRRVSVWSNSPALLMEFQTDPEAPLKPVEIIALQKAPIDSYVSFNVIGANKAFTSWSMEIKDSRGAAQNYGPYTQEWVSLPGKTILGTKPDGTYRVTMTGQTKSGSTVKKDTTVYMVLWTPPQNTEVMRFSIIYEFNESKTTAIYEKYLTDMVLPKIASGATVIIHGYTDIIGEVAYNQELSLARANDARNILVNGLSKAGKTGVKFEVYGFGEDENLSPFANRYPEERFYNRTVVIDIMP